LNSKVHFFKSIYFDDYIYYYYLSLKDSLKSQVKIFFSVTTAQRLQAFPHFRPDQRVKGRTAMQAACNRTEGAHLFDFDVSSMEAQAHASCNRCVGRNGQETAPPLAPLPRLLDCGASTATRGNPAHDPTVPTRHIGHGPVSCRRRHDGRCGQKWAGSNGGGRRAKAAVKSSAKVTSPPGTAGEPCPTV
jgi:hypothetical protein